MSDSKIDVYGSWFGSGVRMPSIDGHPGIHWARGANFLKAIFGGPAEKQYNGYANLKEGCGFLAVADGCAEAGGFRLIQHQPINEENLKDCSRTYSNDHGAMCVQVDESQISVSVDTTDLEAIRKIKVFFDENTTQKVPRGRVYVIVQTREGPQFRSMGIGGLPLERDNYSEEVMKGYDRIVADLSASSPNGRIAILDGKPGTGKTFLVRALLDEVKDAIMVIVPSNLVSHLGQPDMIPALIDLHRNNNGKAMVFLIEDADECLAPRMGDNMSAVSTILNLGDGILGRVLDIRIICTTNADHQEIDEAIKRPGRLSAMVHVGALDPEKACKVYERLTGKPARIYPDITNPMKSAPFFVKQTSLAQVYQIARDAGWTPPPEERKVGFQDDEDDYGY